MKVAYGPAEMKRWKEAVAKRHAGQVGGASDDLPLRLERLKHTVEDPC